ncbi:MAG: hypothetical protein AB1644_03180 [Candidatus Zixiibacteriota bacterium]
MRLHRAIILFTFSLLAAKIPAASPADVNGIQTLAEYFDLVASGNLESAGFMWTESAQERANRFGIAYTGVPLRVDATSPVVRQIDDLRGHLQPPVKQAQMLDSVFVRLEFSTVVRSQQIQWFYYAHKVGGYFWLCYPQDFYGKDWPVETSKYFRIHVHPERQKFLNPVLLAEADRFVERLADTLQIDKKTVAEIAAKKIEYFYCDSDDAVKAITGQVTKGVFDLASNDIISADFPHFHELVHFMVNLRLKEVPISTLPLLREGLAVRFGGRWGKRPSALVDLGSFMIREKIVEVDSILTAKGFEAGSTADIAYPVAGVLCTYLVDRIGLVKFLELYRSLSGDVTDVDTINHIQVHQALARAVGAGDWSAFQTEFDRYLSDGLARWAMAAPGAVERTKEVFRDGLCSVRQNSEWIQFEFASDSAGPPRGNMLFGRDKGLMDKQSYLFAEQYGTEQAFDGFRFGVRFDGNEAGLYDYGTNELVAKYIWGITPSDQYFNATDHTLRIRFKKSLLGSVKPKSGDFKLLPL